MKLKLSWNEYRDNIIIKVCKKIMEEQNGKKQSISISSK